MFTQRRFEAIAEVINAELNTEQSQVSKRAVHNTAQRLAGLFRQHNERFDRQEFYAACGLDEHGTLHYESKGHQMNEIQRKALCACALGIKVEFDEEHYKPAFDLPAGYVCRLGRRPGTEAICWLLTDW